jgi:hypothetical protein
VDIETQRWAPLSSGWLQPPPGGFGWSQPSVDMEEVDGWFVSDLNYATGKVSGAFFTRNITEFAAEPQAWKAVSGGYDDLAAWTDDMFVQESGQGPMPGRIIDIDIDNSGTYHAVFVPNYGKFHRGWWWYRGVAHATTVNKLLNGEAVGEIEAGSKKRLITITQDPNTRHMAFVLQKRRKGDTFWWGVGFTHYDIVNNIAKGKASLKAPSVFPQDNIHKRLVLLEGHRNWKTDITTQVIPGHKIPNPAYDPAKGYDPSDPTSEPPEIWVPAKTITQKSTYEVAPSFLFIMVPNKESLTWKSFPHDSWQAISSYASKHNMRVVNIHPFDNGDSNLFSAVLLKNS